MIRVAGVRFKMAGKIHLFKSGAFFLKPNDSVIVEKEHGLEMGKIVTPPFEIEETENEIRQIVRIATQDDLVRVEEIKEFEKKAFDFCKKNINDLGLVMNLFSVKSSFEKNKLTFFYTAEGRVDFRKLIRLLAKELVVRVEMRQVGIRNLSKHRGGIGRCGREICCSCFMVNFEPVFIKMAKEQGLSLNPTKISGVCGRLMCCLTFENEIYKNIRKKMPGLGDSIKTENGQGHIIRHNILKESITIRLKSNTEIEKNIHEIKNLTQNTIIKK